MSEPGAVAAFDFDGTVSRRDTLVPFLRRRAGTRGLAALTARHSFHIATSPSTRPGSDAFRDALKERVLQSVLGGRGRGEVWADGADYADECLDDLHAAQLEQIRWHRESGHRLVMVSASLDCYLEPLAERLGFDDLICVQLDVGDDGILTGRLRHANVRADEKETRLRRLLGDPLPEIYAYGDSAGDRALLALADHPVPVTHRGHRALERERLRP